MRQLSNGKAVEVPNSILIYLSDIQAHYATKEDLSFTAVMDDNIETTEASGSSTGALPSDTFLSETIEQAFSNDLIDHYEGNYVNNMKAIFDVNNYIQYTGFDDTNLNQRLKLDAYDVELSIVSVECSINIDGTSVDYELDKNSFRVDVQVDNDIGDKHTVGLQNGLIKGRSLNDGDYAMGYINPEDGKFNNVIIKMKQNYFGKEEFDLDSFSIQVDRSYSDITNTIESLLASNSNSLLSPSHMQASERKFLWCK